MDAQQAVLPTLKASTGNWSEAQAYEPYIGRWSRIAAREFVSWLDMPRRSSWLDVGCGTGALSEAILRSSSEARVVAVDRSASYLGYAQRLLRDQNIVFMQGDAQQLQLLDEQFDAVVSALMLNFVADAPRAVAEMARVARHGSRVAAYIWDYARGMEFLRAIWDVALTLDPDALRHDEGHRSPIRELGHLAEVFRGAGLAAVETRTIDIETRFANFDEYWTPFLGGQGTVAGYVCRLPEAQRDELRERLRRKVAAASGPISFKGRALAVRGRRV